MHAPPLSRILHPSPGGADPPAVRLADPDGAGPERGDTQLLERLTGDDLVPRIDEAFETAIDGTPVVLILAEIDVMEERHSRPGARRSFSLIFHGPAWPLLPQGTYALRNKELGALELFIVPLGPGGGVLRYEVVFN